MTSQHDMRLLEIQAIEMELSNQWNNYIYIYMYNESRWDIWSWKSGLKVDKG